MTALSEPNDKISSGYAAVWTDETLIETVLEQAEGYMKKLQKRSKIKIKVPLFDFITYEYDYQKKGKSGLYFSKEIDLSNQIRIKSIPEIYQKIKKAPTFKPFIAQIEQNLNLAIHLPSFFREQLKFLRNIPEVSTESKKELDELIGLPDPTLRQKVFDSKIEDDSGGFVFGIVYKRIEQLVSKYPSIQNDMQRLVNKEKPSIKLSFRGNEYITYFNEKTMNFRGIFPVCFPMDAKYSLPNVAAFTAKVLGIVSFTPNPPLDATNIPPFFLRAVSLFMPYQWKCK